MEEISRLADEEGVAQNSKGAASPKVPLTFHPRFTNISIDFIKEFAFYHSVCYTVGCSAVRGGDG